MKKTAMVGWIGIPILLGVGWVYFENNVRVFYLELIARTDLAREFQNYHKYLLCRGEIPPLKFIRIEERGFYSTVYDYYDMSVKSLGGGAKDSRTSQSVVIVYQLKKDKQRLIGSPAERLESEVLMLEDCATSVPLEY